MTFFSLSQPIFTVREVLRSNVTGLIDSGKKVGYVLRENRDLSRLVAEQGAEITRLEEARLENERLRTLLGMYVSYDGRKTVARVIGRDVTKLSSWILLDRGLNHGIKEQTSVMSRSGLIGKVVEVGSNHARVMLLSDIESRVSGLLQRSRETGLVEGQGEKLLKMTYLDLHADIEIGDLVLTSGLGGIYPKGIPIGKVISIGKDRRGLHLEALIEPIADFIKLEEALCYELATAS